MAEFLIQAKGHWMDAISQSIKDTWDVKMQARFARRNLKGSPIVVRPDGWKWGKSERLPEYIVVKVPSMTVADAEEYILPEYGTFLGPNATTVEKKVKRRKYQFAVSQVDTLISLSQNTTTTSKNTFISLTVDRTK